MLYHHTSPKTFTCENEYSHSLILEKTVDFDRKSAVFSAKSTIADETLPQWLKVE